MAERRHRPRSRDLRSVSVRRPVLAGAVACAACLFGVGASADERPPLKIDWQHITDAFRTGGIVLAPDTADRQVPTPTGAQESSQSGRPLGEEAHSTSGGPDTSLVARDWDGPRLFVGHLSPIDRIRFSRSSRMLVGRVRVPAGRVVPFIQLGLGQWRVDTVLLPYRRDVAYAAQLGYGFELPVASHAAIAFEAEYTFLYRDQRSAGAASLGLWGSFAAARVRF
jgi:hypothetical protein